MSECGTLCLCNCTPHVLGFVSDTPTLAARSNASLYHSLWNLSTSRRKSLARIFKPLTDSIAETRS